VRNQFGLISEVPDDYPGDLMRQLGLEEVHDEDGTEDTEAQPQREGRRSRR
jgi:hypothetical protein